MMSKKKILIIEDESDIAEMIAMRLKKEGFLVQTAGNGHSGWRNIGEFQPDILLLDLMLPGMSGLEILKLVRADRRKGSLPVLILSAKGDESDIVVGLEIGADDYLTKPFSMAVLVARIHALLRRSTGTAGAEGNLVEVGNIVIDLDGHRVWIDDIPVEPILTLTEFRLLAALVLARGRVLTRNQLIDQAIGSDAIVTDRTIDVHLNALRGKLGASRNRIETVRGVGYRMGSF
ncbi:MAG: response regulator transcription factor [Planctomycetaceae bacterium]|jgi:DNA-binding response OmpR family regulator|nr:response regulator transcription factor [Planctomycetaceae bacterium]